MVKLQSRFNYRKQGDVCIYWSINRYYRIYYTMTKEISTSETKIMKLIKTHDIAIYSNATFNYGNNFLSRIEYIVEKV